jgi:hypothetical protein
MRDGVRNVVEFQIQEDVEAQAREFRNCSRTLRGKKLSSNLERPCCSAEFPRQRSCCANMVEV